MSPIYLDYNATTPLLSEVVQAMLPFLTTHFGNPSSDHLYGHRAKKAVDTARQQVASLLECEPDEIIFTSGGTEANNLAIQGIAHARKDKKHIITSAVEHPATAKPCAHLSEQGWKVSRLVVDRDGLISPDQVL
jgi:cysteine desulfurase